MSAQPQVEYNWHVIPGAASPKFIIIDLFCGAGGTSTGYHLAKVRKEMCALVAAAINHDKEAIESHWENHMQVVHFNEDITSLYGAVKYGYLFKSDMFMRLIRLIELYRAFYPDAKIVLWASLECTNFSKAKGGQARDADSRTLAEHLDRYISALDPDYIKIENVTEFMAWGPMRIKSKKSHLNVEHPFTELTVLKAKKDGKIQYGWEPISKKNGQDYMKWREHICGMGYRDKWKELNSADYGAFTSRNRLFGIFHKPSLPASFPKPTHAKNPSKAQGLFKPLLKWNAVKEKLDFTDEGESILNRITPIAIYKKIKVKGSTERSKVYDEPKTIGHAKGLLLKQKDVKAVILLPQNTNNPYPHHPLAFKISFEMAQDFEDIITDYKSIYGSVAFWWDDALSPKTLERVYSGCIKYIAGGKKEFNAFIQQLYACDSKGAGNYSIERPGRTITTRDGSAMVQASFISKQFSGDPDSKNSSIDAPSGAITTIDHHALVNTAFISKYNSGDPDSRNTSMDEPCHAVLTANTHSLVQPQFLTKYFSGRPEGKCISVNEPAGTIMTKDTQALIQPQFIVQRNSGDPDGRVISVDGPARTITASGGNQDLVQPVYLVNYNHSSDHNSPDEPAPTLVTADKLAVVQPSFITKYYSTGDSNHSSINDPAGALTTKARMAKIQAVWLDKQYSGATNHSDINQPAGVIMPNDKNALVQTDWIDRNFTSGGYISSPDEPAGALMPVPKMNLVQTDKFLLSPHYKNQGTSLEDPAPVITANRKHHMLVNPQFNNGGSSVEQPCFTLIAGMYKRSPYLVVTEEGELAIEIYDTDVDVMVKIKEFMALYGIADIKMRMLKVSELLQIQGFPKEYKLLGSQADQKKFIGNSVVPHVVKCWAEQLAEELENFFSEQLTLELA